MDPFDWRELDNLATMLNGRGDCQRDWEMCRDLWERPFVNAPRSSIKARLYQLRTMIVLGGVSIIPEACIAYGELAVERPDQPLVLLVLNNLGVCRLREKEYEEARALSVLALTNAQVDSERADIVKNIAAFDEWDRQNAARVPGSGGEDGSTDLPASHIMF